MFTTRTKRSIRRFSRKGLVLFVALSVFGLARAQNTDTPSGLERANRILNTWVSRKDTNTSLIVDEDDRWSVRTTAASLYPAMVLTAWLTNLGLYDGLLAETLKDERRLTTRLSVFPDDYHTKNASFSRSSRNEEEILINASAYANGLALVATHTGHGRWTDRLRGIVDALFLQASVETEYAEGPLPSRNLRVTGRIMKTLPLLADLFTDEGYLYYARRIADAYCVGVMPKNGGLPAERWDFEDDSAHASSLILEDSGVAFLEGLVELYAVEVRDGTARSAIYRPMLSAMFDVLLQHGLKDNGRFYRRLQPDSRGGYSIDRKRESPHTIRILLTTHRYGRLSGNETYVNAAQSALERYRPANSSEHITAFSSLLSAVTLAPPLKSLVEVVPNRPRNNVTDAEMLRALIAHHLHLTAGVRAHPWRPDLRLLSETDGKRLRVDLRTSEPWEGYLYLPLVGGRIKPFEIDPVERYRITSSLTRGRAAWDGGLLNSGLRARFNQALTLRIESIASGPVEAP